MQRETAREPTLEGENPVFEAFHVTQMAIGNLEMPVAVILGAIAAMAYVMGYLRHRNSPFTSIDALIVAAIMAIVSAVVMPVVNSATDHARATSLRQNLHTLRSQIERYKVEHRGQIPLLFKGGFPQLVQATNVEGIPGPAGKAHPYGPYLPDGIPTNPYTGKATVELVDTFPPPQTNGGGWLYHQKTGRIAADAEEFLDK